MMADMLLLGPDDPLPRCPRRVLVAGTSGSGKTTLAIRIADRLGTARVEIDSLFHGPGWVPRPEFRADVEAFSARPSWVTEWQSREVRDLLLVRADLLVWLDLPDIVVMAQVITRTISRRVHRTVLWNGNVEPPLRTILTDPDHIIRWAWRTRHRTSEQIAGRAADTPIPIVRLRSHAEADRWLDGPLLQVLPSP